MKPGARAVAERMRAWVEPMPLGRVREVAGTIILIEMSGAGLGDIVEIDTSTPGAARDASPSVRAQVVGFRGEIVVAVPLSPLPRIAPHAAVRKRESDAMIDVGFELLGRAIDPFGAPIDGGPPPGCVSRARIDAPALAIAERTQVAEPLCTGIKALDGLLTCGRGQRVGVFAGAGCGKSMLVEQIASHAEVDVVVLGLVGERGREVRDLLEHERKDRMILIAATADRSPLERVRAAMAATSIAEWFRDRRQNVLLVIDSLTRFAMALRELGVAIGEPPATKGYPPSVFAWLPRLVERVAPQRGGGAITAFYTVLVEGDDFVDPVADSARALLDAHVVLSRELAARGHFPAIDVLASASRVARRVAGAELVELSARAREVLYRRRHAQELRALGAYTPGGDRELDEAIRIGERLDQWSRQSGAHTASFDETLGGLRAALDEPRA